MNNAVSFLIGGVIGAIAGTSITYAVMNKKCAKQCDELLNKVRADYKNQWDNVIADLHKDDPSTMRKKRESGEDTEIPPEQTEKELAYLRGYYNAYTSMKKDPENPVISNDIEKFVEPDGPGPDPEDPDALYPITETEMREFIENGEDPEDLLLSADGDLFMSRDFSEYDSPYIFDGIDIEGVFGKYNADPSCAYFRDPVSKINYRILKSAKTDEEMYELAQKGNE